MSPSPRSQMSHIPGPLCILAMHCGGDMRAHCRCMGFSEVCDWILGTVGACQLAVIRAAVSCTAASDDAGYQACNAVTFSVYSHEFTRVHAFLYIKTIVCKQNLQTDTRKFRTFSQASVTPCAEVVSQYFYGTTEDHNPQPALFKEGNVTALRDNPYRCKFPRSFIK